MSTLPVAIMEQALSYAICKGHTHLKGLFLLLVDGVNFAQWANEFICDKWLPVQL